MGDDLPIELQERLETFDGSLAHVEEMFTSLHSIPFSTVQSDLSSLEKAKLDLLGTYAINSLFWIYLNTRGENPKEHGIKQELDRIRSYMGRVKEIQDKEKRPKLNQDSTKRFVRSALWQMAHGKGSPVPALAKPNEHDTEIGQASDTSRVETQQEEFLEEGHTEAKRSKTEHNAAGSHGHHKEHKGRGGGQMRGGFRGRGRGGGKRYHQHVIPE